MRLESADFLHEVTYSGFRDVKAQCMSRRALEIAAATAGGICVITSGPSGADKSILASCFVGILPEMNESDVLDSAAVQSLNYKLGNRKRWPYRAPHRKASAFTS
jgi:magnesium chelatase family protein